MLIGVNLVQLAQPFDDTQSSLEHSYSDSSNLIGQFEVSYFHSDTVEGTTCSALALGAWLFYM